MKKWAVAMAVAILVTAGCGKAPMTELKNDKATEAYKPTLAVDVKVNGHTATITVNTDLKLAKDQIGGARKPGEGHIHIYIDDGEKAMTADPVYVYQNLAPGKHTVNVSLQNNDHTPYDVAKQVTFTIN